MLIRCNKWICTYSELLFCLQTHFCPIKTCIEDVQHSTLWSAHICCSGTCQKMVHGRRARCFPPTAFLFPQEKEIIKLLQNLLFFLQPAYSKENILDIHPPGLFLYASLHSVEAVFLGYLLSSFISSPFFLSFLSSSPSLPSFHDPFFSCQNHRNSSFNRAWTMKNHEVLINCL